MMAKKKATVMVCDNPGCSVARLTEKDDPALGFYFGKGVMHLGWGGGPIPETYACSEQCIAAAVMHSVEMGQKS